METIVTARALTKTFNKKDVVSNVNMSIQKGEIYGFLGPNGAGKTTIMKMFMNLLKPTHGDISIFSERIKPTSHDYLKRIGSMIEYPIFYEKLTAKENLELHCAYMGFHDKRKIDTVLDMIGLQHNHNETVNHYSLGMKQRLGIARAIITRPELLILDEPINGLDASGIKQVRELLQMLNKDYGITILISSHVIKEIEQLADTIGMIRNGTMVSEIPMAHIQAEQTDYLELNVSNLNRACFVLENKLQISNFKVIDDKRIRIFDLTIPQSDITKSLILHDVAINAINKKQMSLENYYMEHVDENMGV